MRIMPKKLSKSLLVSVLALVLVGSAAAAFVWISNIRTTTVTVRPIPITLTGDFINSPYPFQETLQEFDYTVNDPSNKNGYVLVQFTASGQTLNPADIAVRLVIGVRGSLYLTGDLMPGYPTNSPTDTLTFVFGASGTAFDFAEYETIFVYTTYNVAYTIEATIRLTSTAV